MAKYLMNGQSIGVRFIISVICVTLLSIQSVGAHTQGVNLNVLERIAIEKAPEIQEILSTQASVEASAIAEGTYKDPMLQIGLLNVPTDTFNLKQENMTQIKIGVMQEFPRGSSLSLRAKQLQYLVAGQGFKKYVVEEEILRAVRMNYIELLYLLSAKKILGHAKRIFSDLVKSATSTLSVGKVLQHDVLEAQLDLSEIERKLIQIDEDIIKVRANLARFVGDDLAMSFYPGEAPQWQAPGQLDILLQNLKFHPAIRMDDSIVDASMKGIEIANESYKPALSIGAHYSIRQGRSGVSLKKRADFVGVQLSMDLPFFTGNRQDKRVVESTEKHRASLSQRAIDLANLKKEAEEYYASWKYMKAQEELYKTRLIPESKHYAEATLNAYENAQVDFSTLARAQNQSLMIKLQHARLKTNRQKARAYLLYLEAKNNE